jgi:hypothetical protein
MAVTTNSEVSPPPYTTHSHHCCSRTRTEINYVNHIRLSDQTFVYDHFAPFSSIIRAALVLQNAMAVIQEHPQLQVFVESNGVRLREFDGDEGEATAMTRTITKYIEAMSAEEFAVQLELHPPFPRYAMYIKLYIDGKCVRSRIIGDHQYERARGSVKRTFDDMVTKIADGHCISRKFCFSELQIGKTFTTE